VGVGTAEPAWWQLDEAAYRAIADARCEVVKIMVPGLTPEHIARLRQINPNMVIMARLFGSGDELATPEQFANHVRNNLRMAYAHGVRLAEVHNEPNLPGEGLGRYWRDGSAFAQWWLGVVGLLRSEFPEMRWGFPGLSPVANFHSFIGAAGAAVRAADWLGCHVYWDNKGSTWQDAHAALVQFCHDHPDKDVWCTEFSRQVGTDKSRKAEEYRKFVEAPYPANLRGLIGFVLGRDGMAGWEEERWIHSQIPAEVGKRAA